MKNVSRQILAGALLLIFLSSACGVLAGRVPPRREGAPDGQSRLSAATATAAELSALIPVTGGNVVFMQCQFCVADETHAVLIFPDTAYFDVSQPDVTCLTADVVNGRRILICRGPQSTSFNLSICSDSSNCLQFPVVLQPCDLLRTKPAPSVFLTPEPRPKSGGNLDSGGAISTSLPTPPAPNEEPRPTVEPRPTRQPRPTHEPRPTREHRPTKTPKPTRDRS